MNAVFPGFFLFQQIRDADLQIFIDSNRNLIADFPIGVRAVSYTHLAQLARAHGSYPLCRWFKSSSRYLYGILAQLGEHLPYKQRVTGSSPVGPVSYTNLQTIRQKFP